MSPQSISPIKISLLIILFYLIHSCTNNTCEDIINNKLSQNGLFEENSFVLKKQGNIWLVLTSDNVDYVIIESRYSYKIEIDSNSNLILLNHNQINQDDVINVLEEEFLKLVERFKDDDLDKVPNVGFQITYSTKPEHVGLEKISNIICTVNQEITEIKSRVDPRIDSKRLSKLIQPKFTFFPEPKNR